MTLNKARTCEKLKTMTWEELDWLRRKCVAYMETANGPRVYSTHTHTQEEMEESLGGHFEDVLSKHHPGW